MSQSKLVVFPTSYQTMRVVSPIDISVVFVNQSRFLYKYNQLKEVTLQMPSKIGISLVTEQNVNQTMRIIKRCVKSCTTLSKFTRQKLQEPPTHDNVESLIHNMKQTEEFIQTECSGLEEATAYSLTKLGNSAAHTAMYCAFFISSIVSGLEEKAASDMVNNAQGAMNNELARVKTLQDQLTNKQNEMAQYRNSMELQMSQLLQAKEAVERQSEQIQKDSNSYRSAVNDYRNQMSMIQDDMQKRAASYEERIKKLQEDVEEANKAQGQIVEVNTALDALKKEKAQLLERISDVQEENSEYAAMLESKTKDLTSFEDALKKAIDEMDSYEKRVNELNTEYVHAVSEVKEIGLILTSIISPERNLQEFTDEIRAKVLALGRNQISLEQLKADLFNAKAKSESTDNKTEIAELSDQLAKAEEERKNLLLTATSLLETMQNKNNYVYSKISHEISTHLEELFLDKASYLTGLLQDQSTRPEYARVLNKKLEVINELANNAKKSKQKSEEMLDKLEGGQYEVPVETVGQLKAIAENILTLPEEVTALIDKLSEEPFDFILEREKQATETKTKKDVTGAIESASIRKTCINNLIIAVQKFSSLIVSYDAKTAEDFFRIYFELCRLLKMPNVDYAQLNAAIDEFSSVLQAVSISAVTKTPLDNKKLNAILNSIESAQFRSPGSKKRRSEIVRMRNEVCDMLAMFNVHVDPAFEQSFFKDLLEKLSPKLAAIQSLEIEYARTFNAEALTRQKYEKLKKDLGKISFGLLSLKNANKQNYIEARVLAKELQEFKEIPELTKKVNEVMADIQNKSSQLSAETMDYLATVVGVEPQPTESQFKLVVGEAMSNYRKYLNQIQRDMVNYSSTLVSEYKKVAEDLTSNLMPVAEKVQKNKQNLSRAVGAFVKTLLPQMEYLGDVQEGVRDSTVEMYEEFFDVDLNSPVKNVLTPDILRVIYRDVFRYINVGMKSVNQYMRWTTNSKVQRYLNAIPPSIPIVFPEIGQGLALNLLPRFQKLDGLFSFYLYATETSSPLYNTKIWDTIKETKNIFLDLGDYAKICMQESYRRLPDVINYSLLFMRPQDSSRYEYLNLKKAEFEEGTLEVEKYTEIMDYVSKSNDQCSDLINAKRSMFSNCYFRLVTYGDGTDKKELLMLFPSGSRYFYFVDPAIDLCFIKPSVLDRCFYFIFFETLEIEPLSANLGNLYLTNANISENNERGVYTMKRIETELGKWRRTVSYASCYAETAMTLSRFFKIIITDINPNEDTEDTEIYIHYEYIGFLGFPSNLGANELSFYITQFQGFPYPQGSGVKQGQYPNFLNFSFPILNSAPKSKDTRFAVYVPSMGRFDSKPFNLKFPFPLGSNDEFTMKKYLGIPTSWENYKFIDPELDLLEGVYLQFQASLDFLGVATLNEEQMTKALNGFKGPIFFGRNYLGNSYGLGMFKQAIIPVETAITTFKDASKLFGSKQTQHISPPRTPRMPSVATEESDPEPADEEEKIPFMVEEFPDDEDEPMDIDKQEEFEFDPKAREQLSKSFSGSKTERMPRFKF